MSTETQPLNTTPKATEAPKAASVETTKPVAPTPAAPASVKPQTPPAAKKVVAKKATTKAAPARKAAPAKKASPAAKAPAAKTAAKKPAQRKVTAKTRATAQKTSKPKSKTTSQTSKSETGVDALTQTVKAFEQQIKSFQKNLTTENFEMGDMQIANAEIRKIFEATNESALKAANDLNTEIQSFTKKNVEDGLAANAKLMKVKSLPELVEVQSKLTQDAMQEYMAHSRTMFDIANNAAQDAIKPMSESWSNSIDQMRKMMPF